MRAAAEAPRATRAGIGAIANRRARRTICAIGWSEYAKAEAQVPAQPDSRRPPTGTRDRILV